MVKDIRIGGQGCSISQSSASMMSSAVKGRTIDEVRALSRAFKAMMSIHEQSLDGEAGPRGNGSVPDEAEAALDAAVKLGDLEALRGVVKFPVRIKCATLSWNALSQGLDELARELGMGLIAEGIETAAEAEALLALDCPHAQGILFSEPLPAEAITTFLFDFALQAPFRGTSNAASTLLASSETTPRIH